MWFFWLEFRLINLFRSYRNVFEKKEVMFFALPLSDYWFSVAFISFFLPLMVKVILMLPFSKSLPSFVLMLISGVFAPSNGYRILMKDAISFPVLAFSNTNAGRSNSFP
ncbi:hypothetical protein D3C73_902500 [compost metagenome]